MAEFERQGYTPPIDKFPHELRLRPEIYRNLQLVASENRQSVLENLVMGQAFLEMLDIEDQVKEFAIGSFDLPLEYMDIIQANNSYAFYETENKQEERKEMNVFNMVEVSLTNSVTNQISRFGIGIINMNRIGGFVGSYYLADTPSKSEYIDTSLKVEVPSHNDSVKQVEDDGTELQVSNEGVLAVDKKTLLNTRNSIPAFLKKAYKRYWENLDTNTDMRTI